MSDQPFVARQRLEHIDGTPIFQTRADRRAEGEVGAVVGLAFGCNIHSFGQLATVDWWAERHGRTIGVLELKIRTQRLADGGTVSLSVRKWLSLANASFGLGCPALFVVQFVEDIRWIPLTVVDASNHRVGEAFRLVKGPCDIEPLIEIPVADMRRLPTPPAGPEQ
jgi:hypothetical protein